jgi:hypothetical protein
LGVYQESISDSGTSVNSSNLNMTNRGRCQRNYYPRNLPAEGDKRFGLRSLRQHTWPVPTRFFRYRRLEWDPKKSGPKIR